MGYQDLLEKRYATQRLARRSRSVSLMVSAFLLYAVGGLAVWAAINGVFEPERQPNFGTEDRLVLSYGFDRDPITRTYTVDTPAPQASDINPADLNVRLARDLKSSVGPGEFPAEQVVVGVTRLSATRVSLTITANPWTPERVAAGVYDGTIQVRGPSVSQDVPMTVWLRTREHRWAGVAFGLIFAGATLGLLVKYITERLTPQATLIRRLSQLKRSLGYRDDGATLPANVRIQIDDLDDQIARSEYAQVDNSFADFDKTKVRLAAVSVQFGMLLDQIDAQERAVAEARLTANDRLLIEGVLEAEYRVIQDAQTLHWPEEEADIVARAREARASFSAVHVILGRFINSRSPSLRRMLFDFQQGYLPTGYDLPPPTPDEESGDSGSGDIDSPREKAARSPLSSLRAIKGDAVSPLFRHARSIAGFASILVVSLAGLKTQYLDNQAFDGHLTDWLTLGLWGAVVELSGVAVLDVLGRLGGNAAAATAKP